jgi:hypothetical protein
MPINPNLLDDAEPIPTESSRRPRVVTSASSASAWTPTDVLRLALEALAARSLVWVATAAGIALWTMGVLHPEPWRLLAALGYCGAVLVPVLIRDQRGGER